MSKLPSKGTDKKANDDPLFSRRGSPALMSSKEPALNLLRERYSETFALTKGNEKQVHLFLVKVGMWSLVWTFTPRDVNREEEIGLDEVLQRIESTLKGGSPEFLARLDASVQKAKDRIKNKAEQFRAG
ncbi:MAG: hypothetical protein ACYCPP_05890 [Nitrososphaerales archaeon]